MQNVPYYERFISTSKIKLTGETLGKGAFGEVEVVELTKDDSNEIDSSKQTIEYDYNIKYAMKSLNGMNNLTYLIREGCLLNSLNHPFIINLTACCFFKHREFEPSFINPIAKNGTLIDLIQNKRKHANLENWTPFDFNKLIYSICRSIWFLHKIKIWHRDIKNENILIMKDRTPRLSDLGLAKYKTEDIGNSIIGGTQQYAPPDICISQASFPTDVFSLGLSLWELFEKQIIDSFFKKLCKKRKTSKFLTYKNEKDRPPFSKTPKIWQDLISIMWKTNIQERPTMDEVIKKIEKPEYFLPDVDENEMELFIENVKKEEFEAYFCKSNSTTRYLKNVNSINPNDENNISSANNYSFSNTKNYFDEYFNNCPIDIIIEQFLENSLIEDEEDQLGMVYREDCFSDQSPEKDIDERIKENNKYNSFYHSYLRLIYGLFGLSELNDEESIISIVSFCMVNLYDYVTAYKLLKKLESINKLTAKSFLSLIEEESKHSLFIKGMLLEAQEKFQEAVDTYYDCIENAEMDCRVLSSLGRLLAILGDTEDLKEEGMQLLENAYNFGDQYASYTLGVIYLGNEQNEKAIKYLEKADRFPDSYLQLYIYYQKEYLKDKKRFSNFNRYQIIVQGLVTE